MMKKIPAGVKFIGLIYIITSPIGFFTNIGYLIKYSNKIDFSDGLITTVFIALNALATIIGLNTLRLKELWRKINLYYCLFMISYFIISSSFKNKFSCGGETAALYLIFYVSIIIYLARSKIKEQFK
ncbi:MAG: hypothetical protein ABIH18_06010 [Candidatus Omnitrophota bacterium]